LDGKSKYLGTPDDRQDPACRSTPPTETLALAESNNVAVIRGWGSAHLLRPIRHVICVRGVRADEKSACSA